MFKINKQSLFQTLHIKHNFIKYTNLISKHIIQLKNTKKKTKLFLNFQTFRNIVSEKLTPDFEPSIIHGAVPLPLLRGARERGEG